MEEMGPEEGEVAMADPGLLTGTIPSILFYVFPST